MSLALPSEAAERQSGIKSLAIPRHILVLVLLLAAALLLRVLFIDSRGLWSDEAYRVLAARQSTIFDTLRAAWAQPPSAPLYWVALHVWVALFGHGDVVVRLFSVPASVATLVVTYALGRMVGGRWTALLSTALLAISPFAIETGQEATMYAWSALFATCALWAGLSWLRTGRGMALYVTSAALLLYTHYMGILLLLELLALGLVWVARTKNKGETSLSARQWIKAHLLIGVIYLPWAIAMGVRLAQRADELSHLEHRAGLSDLYDLLATITVAPGAVASWSRAEVVLSIVVGAGLALISLVLPRSGEQKHIVWMFAAIALGFLSMIVGISALTGEWLVQPRFVTLILPAMLVVIASALPLERTIKGPLPLSLAVMLLIAAWLFVEADGIRAFYTNPVHGRDGVREAAAWLNTERQPGDLAVTNNGILAWSLAQYHDGPILGLPESLDVRDGYRLWPTPDLMDEAPEQWQALTHLAPGARRIWLVYLPVMDPHNELMQSMQQNYRLAEERRYTFADVYLFAPK